MNPISLTIQCHYTSINIEPPIIKETPSHFFHYFALISYQQTKHISKYLAHGYVITFHIILWNMITYPCLVLHKSPVSRTWICNYIPEYSAGCDYLSMILDTSLSHTSPHRHINDLAQDCSNSIADAMELLQSCTKPAIWIIEIIISSRSTCSNTWRPSQLSQKCGDNITRPISSKKLTTDAP